MIHSRKLVLRPPEARDERAFLAVARASRRLHTPWISPPLARAAYRKWLRDERPNRLRLLVFDRGVLAGYVGINDIVRGITQTGNLAYWVAATHARRGVMTQALRAVIRHAFQTLRLHRLEAGIQPGNRASKALVKRLGFRYEGLAKRLIKIRGRWRDHERWAILADEVKR